MAEILVVAALLVVVAVGLIAKTSLAALIFVLGVARAFAADAPSGVWRIDDAKGRPDALVRIFEQNGLYFGRFEKLFHPDPAGDRCTACTDDRKDQPLVGMIFLSDFKPEGDHYAGRVLDPNTGKIYRCHLRVVDGDKLEVRGFVGVSLLGRTQVWRREK